MKNMLFPYETPASRLDLNLTVKGVAKNDDERTIIFTDKEAAGRNNVPVSVQVHVPQTELSELGYGALQVICLAKCGVTDVRQTVRLSRSTADLSLWSGKLELDRRQFRGEATIYAVLTGTVDGIPYRFLSETDPWTFLLDEAAGRPLQGTLPVKWLDFSEKLELKPYLDEPFHVDLEEAVPTIYLNKRIDGLPDVLPNEGQPLGPLRSMYETVRTSIARSAWLALFNASLAGIIAPPEGSEGEDPSWPVTRWQHDVLRRILPRVYPDVSDTEALRQAVNARASEHETRQLASRAILVIEHDVLRDGTSLRRALNAMNEFLQKEDS